MIFPQRPFCRLLRTDGPGRQLLVRGLLLFALLVASGCVGQIHTKNQAIDEWQTRLGADSKDAGLIWDFRRRRALTWNALVAQARASRVVLIGEKHDNSDHHLLQAAIVEGLDMHGLRPTLVFEMLHVGQAKPVESLLWRNTPNWHEISRALQWQEGGWPEFSMYRPIFEWANRYRLQIRGGNLPRATVAAIVKDQSLSPLADGHADVSTLSGKLRSDNSMMGAMANDIQHAHCGHLPQHLDAFVLAQLAKDAQMALSLVDALSEPGKSITVAPAVMMAGASHVRKDRGLYAGLMLELEPSGAFEQTVLSIGIVELPRRDSKMSAKALQESLDGVYDILIFTPRVSNADPCEAFRQQHKQIRS